MRANHVYTFPTSQQDCRLEESPCKLDCRSITCVHERFIRLGFQKADPAFQAAKPGRGLPIAKRAHLESQLGGAYVRLAADSRTYCNW
jgi:hypothetical protein